MNDFEGIEFINHLLTETDASLIKTVTPVLVVGGIILYALKEDKLKDVTELVSESKGILSTVLSKVL